MNAHSRDLAAAGVYELHPLPDRPLPKRPDAEGPLFVGDVVIVRFSRVEGRQPDRRGTITQMYRHDRYQIECLRDDGTPDRFSAPRDLLTLVRRGDA